ncbi:MAG: DNA-3-methyladenine glycosylase family protein [Gammaproteobacteria bacterium]
MNRAAPPVLTPALLRLAEAHIAAADSRMAKIIAAHGPLRKIKTEPPFHVLSVSIINQQLSQTAADAIESRIAKIVPPPFSADDMAKAPALKLRAAGLSGKKIEYLHEIARRAKNGALPFGDFARLADEEIIALLSAAPGVGKWTAEMFLMFALGRADVVSPGDAALRRAARNIYGNRFRGEDEEVLQKAAQKWRPYRTVGCRYLWESLRK